MIIKKNNSASSLLGNVKYSARRGMLELDILLAPYLDNCYSNESEEDKELFIKFLSNEDNDIFDWLFRGVIPPLEFEVLVRRIIQEKKLDNQNDI